MTAADIESVALHEATRQRYLNYALSVITARALPDVRDGMKPVQRRILYAMYHNLHLHPDGRFRKSAAVVGEVMAKYHPHGDSSIYEALVRMAQPFSLRHPLVDGQGNFGSLDGDGAAAMRYTECRLQKLSIEMLSEIKQRTVDFRPNYDGQHLEPEILPAQFPQLLVNGAEGIAVGMATRIPPHNLREVIDGAVLLIDQPDADVTQIARKIKGPDFPTGGVILNDRAELAEIYATGHGSVRVRGRWITEKSGRRHHVIITEIPYGVNKASLVEKIGAMVASRRLPQVTDVRDESTEEIRVVLELRSERDAAPAMAWLFKHTPLQSSFHVNLTALVPTGRFPEPRRCNIHEILRYWLDFRYDTVRRRLEFELQKLRERIHILEGFEKIFDALDEAIRIIRESEGKRDAAEGLIERFDLSDIQAEAILELRLYKLARMEIAAIREELEEKRTEAARIEALLASRTEMWSVVRGELLDIRKFYGEKRRTSIGGQDAEAVEYSEADYIVAEDTFVIVTRDGWIKRQGSFKEIDRIRIRDGDEIGWFAHVNTRRNVTFFGDQGGAFVMRVDDIPVTTGYGGPIQRHFHLGDGERIVGVVFHDPRALPRPVEGPPDEPPPPYAVAVTRAGRTARFLLSQHAEPSTRNGRRFIRLSDERDRVVAVWTSDGREQLSLASEQGRALCFPVREINLLKAAGKGVTAMKLRPDDRIFAFQLTLDRASGATVTTPQGREEVIRPAKYAGSRGGRGKVVLKRDRFVAWLREIVRYDLMQSGDQQTIVPEDR